MPLCTDYTQGRGAVQALPGRGAFTLNVIIAIIGVKATIWLLSHPPPTPHFFHLFFFPFFSSLLLDSCFLMLLFYLHMDLFAIPYVFVFSGLSRVYKYIFHLSQFIFQ